MPRQRNKIISGVSFDPAAHDLLCHLTLFRFAPKLSLDPLWRWEGAFDEQNPEPYIGLGRYEHAKALDTMIWPTEFEYHKYSEEHTQAFCDNREIAITGGGGTSKSTSLAAYALKFHWCDPENSAVLIVSTTVEAAERRVWREILRLYYIAHRKLKNIYGTVPIRKPKPMIHMRDEEGNPDISHGLFVIAVAKGELDKGINSIKGYHVKRLLYGLDETDAVHQACVDVKANISIGCDEFQAVYLGNDPSLLNPLGQLMQPERGKPVTLAHKQWTSYDGVYCIRSSAYDSPNIPDKKYQGIVSQTDIDEITRHGTRKNTAMSWIMLEGLHPPEGCDETVLSESALFQYNCFEDVTWQRSYIESASLDAGFGGHPCLLRFFKRGTDLTGKLRILLTDRIEIPIEDRRDYRAEEAIADKCMELCKARGIPPEEFVVGATGIGRGVASALMRKWSPRIIVCEEGGACSDLIVSEEDPRPAKEIYDRKVTELYFSIREFVEADMIRGMDIKDTALQLCNRKHELKSKKKSLESKKDMKDRGQPSPNDSDCLAFYIHMLRESKGINASVQTPIKTNARKELLNDFASNEPNEEDMYEDPIYDEVEV